MEICFKDRKLEKIVNDDRKLFKEFGRTRALKIRARLSQLLFAETLDDVRHMPGNYHELSGNRKGQWACDLDQPFRLIFTPQEKPVPINAYGQYIWAEVTGIEVIEIVDYH
ncbi:type II toxin-antitoxin system RelE/ParE family toxin [Dyadobacter crusticola]|uniref:type II toxin-antitoxin system RelE/ParE family toxin n=1 Tax=Dyadobacter crusticola TaxID=292407 RepID=UPI0004E103BF|nr:type II toxin-antitoxin system RelE/ParE family toxin [Dyadobacter crusticola]